MVILPIARLQKNIHANDSLMTFLPNKKILIFKISYHLSVSGSPYDLHFNDFCSFDVNDIREHRGTWPKDLNMLSMFFADNEERT